MGKLIGITSLGPAPSVIDTNILNPYVEEPPIAPPIQVAPAIVSPASNLTQPTIPQNILITQTILDNLMKQAKKEERIISKLPGLNKQNKNLRVNVKFD